MPVRDRVQHRNTLLAQLDQIAVEVRGRPSDQRDSEATRELVAVLPEPAYDIAASSLQDMPSGVHVVGLDPETGTVLIDAPDSALTALRRKIEAFGDPSNVTRSGRPANEPLVAPIRAIRSATLADIADLAVQSVEPAVPHWVELACRGGVYAPGDSERSRRELERQLRRINSDLRVVAQFTTTFQVVLYSKLTIEQMRALIQATDCLYEIHLAVSTIRDWLYRDHDALDLSRHVVDAPPDDAPIVAILDTGVSSSHPLLSKALRSVDSVVPGIQSGVDIDGHGTQMAGVALYAGEVGAVVQLGGAVAPHWLQAVKIITSDSNSSDESARATWAPMTVAAVAKAEAQVSCHRRVFAMAVTAAKSPLAPTSWSQAIEQLAYNDGLGRLICISAGNADSGNVNVLNGYPQLNLVESIQDPAHAWNALTIGAYTDRDEMPKDDEFAAYSPIAPAGGISPHSSSRPLDAERVGNKPDVVLEGGNVAFDGVLPDATVATLTTLTTGHRPNRPLASIWATSEAAGRGGHLSAKIWTTEADLRPETVRGLIVHAATWTSEMLKQFTSLDDRLRICGYGVPDLEFAQACARDRATIVIEDSMPNAVMVAKPRKKPAKRKTTSPTEAKPERLAKFFRLPVDDDVLLEHRGSVELRVTLSYFAEVETYRRRAFRGMDLRWDMQGPGETADAFRWRINKRVRESVSEKYSARSFDWTIGPQRRSRGTVQSDRWTGPASYLAGHRLIAVMPVVGWWDQYAEFREKQMRFSLIVTIKAPGLDVYSPIEIALKAPIVVTV